MADPTEEARELLPCPFCGSSVVKPQELGDRHWIECEVCATTGPAGDNCWDAQDAWNRRAWQPQEVTTEMAQNVINALWPRLRGQDLKDVQAALTAALQVNPPSPVGRGEG